MEEIKLKSILKAHVNGATKDLIYVRNVNGMLGCVEVDNTSEFHLIHKEKVLAIKADSEIEYIQNEVDEDYEFEVDRSYFIHDPEGKGSSDKKDKDSESEPEENEEPEESESGEGEESDNDDTGSEGEAEGEGQEGEENDADPSNGGGDGEPTDGDTDSETPEDAEYSPSDKEGKSGEIVAQQKHPDEIVVQTIQATKKKRFN